MSLSQDEWKAMYAVFDPTARVEYEDRDLFVARPGAVADSIADDLRLGLEKNGKWVVCGAMGSGKSSELVELAHRLQETHAVIGLDLPQSVARIDKIQPAEVLYLIGLAAIRAAEERWNHEVGEAAQTALHTSFRPLLGANSLEINPREIVQGVSLLVANVATGAPTVGGVVSGATRAFTGVLPRRLRRRTPLGGVTRSAGDGDPEINQLRLAVDAVLEDIGSVKAPVVLVDGLDKIVTSEPIRALFSDSRMLAEPRVPVIYTGPLTLMLATEWQATAGLFRRERLTNVVLHRPERDSIKISEERVAEGRQTMKSVIERRLYRLRGNKTIEEVFEAPALERIIDMSGGLLRDLIHLVNRAVRSCLRQGASRITGEIAEAAISEMRKEYEVTLNSMRVAELVHVAATGEPSGKSEESAELLLRGYVLPYANGRVWFEPHPLLRGLRPGL